MQISQLLRWTLIRRPCGLCQKLIYRSIYTDDRLSVTKYLMDREQLRGGMLDSSVELKKQQLRKYLRCKEIPLTALARDLIQFVHFIENTDEDLELLVEMLDKLKRSKPEDLRRSNIGATVMKMLHHFRNDEVAVKLYSDRILRKTYLMGKQANLIYFDLLYKQSKYSNLLQHFDELKKHLNNHRQFISRSLYALIFATCYNQNTSKSFDYAKNLHDECGHASQDHLIYFSALALNQNAPNLTYGLLSTLWPKAHEAIASLRLIALIQMRKFEDSLQMMRSILLVFDNNRAPKSEVIALEVIQKTEEIFNQYCDDDRLKTDFSRLRDNLQAHGYIVDKKLTDMIYEEFKSKMTENRKNKLLLQAEFNRKTIDR